MVALTLLWLTLIDTILENTIVHNAHVSPVLQKLYDVKWISYDIAKNIAERWRHTDKDNVYLCTKCSQTFFSWKDFCRRNCCNEAKKALNFLGMAVSCRVRRKSQRDLFCTYKKDPFEGLLLIEYALCSYTIFSLAVFVTKGIGKRLFVRYSLQPEGGVSEKN